jgi:hypothetical protein
MMTTTSTLAARKREIIWNDLPRLFKDALTVTAKLGFQYLWIDCLCILQDSVHDWEVESSRMSDIYSAAFATIVAVSCHNSDEGFLSPRFNKFSLPFISASGERLEVRGKLDRIPLDSDEPIYQRAWVFQEQFLSRRLLLFNKNEIALNCDTRWCECQSKFCHRGIGGSFAGGKSVDPDQWNAKSPHIQWRLLVEAYMERKLTKLSDRLPALSGIVMIYQDKINSLYLAGLWKDSLIDDLCWERVRSAPMQDALPTYRAPTFSWASLETPIRYPTARDNGGAPCTVKYTHVWCRKPEIVDAHTVLKGLNQFGEVTDGNVILDGVLAEVMLEFSGTHHYIVWSKKIAGLYSSFSPDCHLIPRELPSAKGTELAAVRSTTGRSSEPFRAEAYLLCISPNKDPIAKGERDGTHKALLLGRSTRVHGAFERLGFIQRLRASKGYGYESEIWFEDVTPSQFRIV